VHQAELQLELNNPGWVLTFKGGYVKVSNSLAISKEERLVDLVTIASVNFSGKKHLLEYNSGAGITLKKARTTRSLLSYKIERNLLQI
jgi:hypothetical protein